MGRYDNIRVWNGSSWVQPNQMKVWNGSSWVDFGTNTSTNTRKVIARNGSSWQAFSKHRVDTTTETSRWLEYAGGNGISMGNKYQWYPTTASGKTTSFDFEVEFSSQGNYMLFESYYSGTKYTRFGVYVKDNVFYAYIKSAYPGYNDTEVTTASKGTMSAGVYYSIWVTLSGTKATLNVENKSTGTTWTVSGTVNRWYQQSGSVKSNLFASPSLSGRNLYGKVKYVYVSGVYMSASDFYWDQYSIWRSSTTGSNVMGSTSSNNIGSVTHYGTIKANSTTTTTYEMDTI